MLFVQRHNPKSHVKVPFKKTWHKWILEQKQKQKQNKNYSSQQTSISGTQFLTHQNSELQIASHAVQWAWNYFSFLRIFLKKLSSSSSSFFFNNINKCIRYIWRFGKMFMNEFIISWCKPKLEVFMWRLILLM